MRPALHGEALLAQQAVSTKREQALRRDKRGNQQHLRHVARGIAALVRHQHQLVFVETTPRLRLPARNPRHERGRVGAPGFVRDARGHAPSAARGLIQTHDDGPGVRDRRQLRNLHGLLAPLALDLAVLAALRPEHDGRAGDGGAVNIGDDQLKLQRLARRDKRAVTAQTHIGSSRVHHHRGRRCPGLTVDVRDRALGRHHPGTRRARGACANLEPVGAIRARPAREAPVVVFGLVVVVVAAPAAAPPRDKLAKREAVPARGRVASGLCRHLPCDVRASERATGVIGRSHGHRHRITRNHGAWVRGGCHLVLGPAELRNLEFVHGAGAGVRCAGALGHKLQHRLAEASRRGQGKPNVKPAKPVHRRAARDDLVAHRVARGPGDQRHALRRGRQITQRPAADHADPPLDAHRLAGPVQAAIVERHDPDGAGLVGRLPGAVPVAGAQHCGVRAAAGDQGGRRCLGRERKPRRAVSRADRARLANLQRNPAQRRTRGKVRDPSGQAVVVRGRVQAKLRCLHPRPQAL